MRIEPGGLSDVQSETGGRGGGIAHRRGHDGGADERQGTGAQQPSFRCTQPELPCGEGQRETGRQGRESALSELVARRRWRPADGATWDAAQGRYVSGVSWFVAADAAIGDACVLVRRLIPDPVE